MAFAKKLCEDLDCCVVGVSKKPIGTGKITIDSGAAESVMPADMLSEVKLVPSEGSRNGIHYVAANGGRMPNLGEKQVHFQTPEGGESNVVFQVTHARKPLVSVSRMVRKGNKVVFGPDEAYIENVATGKRIMMQESNGAYEVDVVYLGDQPFPRHQK